MIRPDYREGPVLDGFRTMYRSAKLPFVMLPEAIRPEHAAQLRAEIEPRLEPFYLADRGRYHMLAAPPDAPLCQELRQIAAFIVEQPLTIATARWLRFRHRDYSLMRDDRQGREAGRQLEVTCDFSESSTPEGQFIYTDGNETLVMPQWACSLVLADKPATLYRYERYLTHAVGAQAIFRLRLLLQYR